MNADCLGLASNWLDAPSPTLSVAGDGLTCGSVHNISGIGDYWQYGYQWPSMAFVYTAPAKPIRLSFSEVEKLKKAAKADDGLRAILAKFTDQIEVIVDFGK